jgi:hypothetical protein
MKLASDMYKLNQCMQKKIPCALSFVSLQHMPHYVAFRHGPADSTATHKPLFGKASGKCHNLHLCCNIVFVSTNSGSETLLNSFHSTLK